ncbi:MAG: hypothetical protein ACRDGN_02825 [bacterium]
MPGDSFTPQRQELAGVFAESLIMVDDAGHGPGAGEGLGEDRVVVEVLAPGFVGTGISRTAGGAVRSTAKSQDASGEESYRLLRFLDRLRDNFGARIEVHLIEPLSFVWMLRVIRFRPRRYPVFVVGGREIISGLDEAAVARTVAALLHSAAPG